MSTIKRFASGASTPKSSLSPTGRQPSMPYEQSLAALKSPVPCEVTAIIEALDFAPLEERTLVALLLQQEERSTVSATPVERIVPMSQQEYEDACARNRIAEQQAVAFAMLLGAETMYDDYGHPERVNARQYWRCTDGGITAYGYTQGGAAMNWLQIKGHKIEKGVLVSR